MQWDLERKLAKEAVDVSHLPLGTVIVKWIIRKLISNVMGANTFIAALNDQINVDLCKLYHKDKNNLLEIILFYYFILYNNVL